jgi:hypothetical protein
MIGKTQRSSQWGAVLSFILEIFPAILARKSYSVPVHKWSIFVPAKAAAMGEPQA